MATPNAPTSHAIGLTRPMVVSRDSTSAWLIPAQTGNIITPSSNSVSGVQAAINSAVAGDTVRLIAGQNATWAGQVTCAKAIKLDFNGVTITRNWSSGSVLLAITAPAAGVVRVTNGAMSGGSTMTGFECCYMSFDGSSATPRFRLDNFVCNTAGNNTHIHFKNGQAGLVDHCTFHAANINEILHNRAYGSGSTTGWGYAVTQGSSDAVYIEDCTFPWSGSGAAGAHSAMQNYYGSRTVFRYNTIHNANFDNHGTAGSVGGRWYEIYNNTWIVSNNLSKCLQIRAGSGVIFNNVCQNNPGAAGGRALNLWEEDGGAYPVLYQIGRGQNQVSDPLYLWNNTNTNNGGGTGGMGISVDAQTSTNGQGAMIQANRDYFTAVKSGYTAFTYPHPLQAT